VVSFFLQERNNPVYLEVGAFLESEIMGVGGGNLFHKKTRYVNTPQSSSHILILPIRSLCTWRKDQVFLLPPKET